MAEDGIFFLVGGGGGVGREGSWFNVQVNSYGSYPVHILSASTLACTCQQHFLNQQKEEIDRRKYFKINLHKSMGLDRDQTHEPWISNLTPDRMGY